MKITLDSIKRILKDSFLMSFFLFIFFNYIQWTSPEIFHYNPSWILLFPIMAGLFWMHFDKNKNKLVNYKTVFALSVLFLIAQDFLILLGLTSPLILSFSSSIKFITFFVAIVTGSYLIFTNKRNGDNLPQKTENKGNKLYLVVLVIISLWGGFLIFHNLGKNDIFHDEKWHVQVIESLNHGSGFKKWNFIAEQPGEKYTRGPLVNTAGFLMVKTFGWSEFNLRLFPAIIGVLLIPLIFLILRHFIGSFPALLTSLILTFNITFIFLARFLRPYTTFLFFYLLTIYFSEKVFENLFKKNNIKKSLLWAIPSIFSFSLSMQASQQAKILLLTIPLSFAIHFIFSSGRKRINKKTIASFLILITGLLIFVELISLTNLSITIKQIFASLSLEKIIDPQEAYFDYLFVQNIRLSNLLLLFFSLGVFASIKNLIKFKDFRPTIIFLHAIIPFGFLVFLLNRYDDFRYSYFVIPFLLAIVMFGIFETTKSLLKTRNAIIISFFLVFLIFKPIIPIKNISEKIAIKNPSVWENDDGKRLLHTRAVAPEYKKAFDYLEQNQKRGDSVIIHEGSYYLKKDNEMRYFELPRKSKYIKNKAGQEIDFFEIVKRETVYVIVSYIRLINNDIDAYLKKNCNNLSPEIGVNQYSYTGGNENSYWPNLFLCK